MPRPIARCPFYECSHLLSQSGPGPSAAYLIPSDFISFQSTPDDEWKEVCWVFAPEPDHSKPVQRYPMRWRTCLAVACAACAIIAAVNPAGAGAQPPVRSGLYGTSPTYGYNPYKVHYGPIYAQRELDYLTFRPGVRGLDYGYGIGYWFGFGPPKQYRMLPPTQQTRAMQARR